MKVKDINVTIREIAKNYQDGGEKGVIGYNGKLNIRPKYQREFIYKDKQRDLVINTITNNFPLNVMYWADNGNGNYEIIDGQQRTISFCQYINGDFSFNNKYFHNLLEEEKKKILNYELMVYICTGTDKEKLEWFRIVNIAGEKLTDQELRNAVYSGPWISDAKRYFSKTGCAAYEIGKKYLKGTAIRQEYLETAIKWASKGHIEEYMAKHQHHPSANKVWRHFQNVISWVGSTFPNYRKEMKGQPWGELYDEFKEKKIDPKKMEEEIKSLMVDEDVTNKRGIYHYVLTRKEKYLNIRAFSERQKREAYERQDGLCAICGNEFDYDKMDGDHIMQWNQGGKTVAKNCQMLCIECNRSKNKK